MSQDPVPDTERQETLIEQLQGPNGAALSNQLKASLDDLQARLKTQEQRGVPPQQAEYLSAALLAVKSAHGTLSVIQVGAENIQTSPDSIPQKGPLK